MEGSAGSLLTSEEECIRLVRFAYICGTYRSKGGAPGPGPVLGGQLLGGIGPLGGVGHAVLGLAVLGQVQGSDLLGLLDLLLVGLHL